MKQIKMKFISEFLTLQKIAAKFILVFSKGSKNRFKKFFDHIQKKAQK
jgi:hypothetical protein